MKNKDFSDNVEFPKRLPSWMKKKRWEHNEELMNTKKILRKAGLNTVCESARCPNIGECFSKPTATFLIMGDRCTRSCSFCSVDKTTVLELDPLEPERIACVVKELALKHVVITSVTRDDLPLGGAEHFAKTVKAVRKKCPGASVEVLTPDFNFEEEAIRKIISVIPDIFNHNMETVSRLYPSVRPQASYQGSLDFLSMIKKISSGLVTKSGFMLGLGEEKEEVEELMRALRSAKCDMLTIGQYLRPSKKNIPVTRYLEVEEFEEFGKIAEKMGFSHVFSAPFARSSFHAKESMSVVKC